MASEMTIEYEDCDTRITVPLVLREDQTLLGNASLADQLIAMADAQHDATCPVHRAAGTAERPRAPKS